MFIVNISLEFYDLIIKKKLFYHSKYKVFTFSEFIFLFYQDKIKGENPDFFVPLIFSLKELRTLVQVTLYAKMEMPDLQRYP